MFPICDCQSYWDNVKKYHEDTTGLPTEHATWRISNHASSLLQLLKMLKAWSNGRNGVPKDMETLWKLRKNVRGLTIWPYLTRVMHRAIDPLFDTNTQCIQVSFPRVILRMFRLVRTVFPTIPQQWSRWRKRLHRRWLFVWKMHSECLF